MAPRVIASYPGQSAPALLKLAFVAQEQFWLAGYPGQSAPALLKFDSRQFILHFRKRLSGAICPGLIEVQGRGDHGRGRFRVIRGNLPRPY